MTDGCHCARGPQPIAIVDMAMPVTATHSGTSNGKDGYYRVLAYRYNIDAF